MIAELAGWLPLALVLLLVLGWYLSYSAARLDRLHHRVESTRAALDVQLVRRSAIALESAAVLDPATGVLLAGAASEVLDGEPRELPAPAAEELENDLTRALYAAFEDPAYVAALGRDPVAGDVLESLRQACVKVALARRFHNDAVAAAQRVRRKRVVRWARLAGRAPMPQMVEIDDTLPPGLAV